MRADLPTRSRTVEPLTIVGLGEVLFDVFEDGTETLGGAPLNVAVHAHQLLAPLGMGEGVVVSRIGNDRHGRHILDLLERRGMSTRYMQLDHEHPTGRVSVFMHRGEPGYQIEPGAAWDFIHESETLDELAATCSAVCFGSLAQRVSDSRGSIIQFLQNAPQAVRLYDVNLRRNKLTGEAGYSTEIIEHSCALATMMKLNIAELAEICSLFGLDPGWDEREDAVRRGVDLLLNRFPVEYLILTRAEDGTTLFARGGEFHGNFPIPKLLDAHPVGAGDACSAGILCGIVLGWTLDATVDLANRMGAWVASQLSATPPLAESILSFVRADLAAQTAMSKQVQR